MNASPEYRSDRSGVALIIALCFLVLLSALVVGFFTSANTEFVAADSFSAGTKARMLGDSAVNVVIGQIQAATSRTNGAWASQPGMIRVYRDGESASPGLDALFKLYSSNRLIVSRADASRFRFADEVPEGSDGWFHQPALFTDLNEPVKSVPRNSEDGKVVDQYPILDPRAFTEKDEEGKPAVEGFELVSNPEDDSGRLARMPVRWIYVLRDGTLTAPDDADREGRGAVWRTEGGESKTPTKANPIVGRIAFWADDETSKVNINTAGGHIWKQDEKWLQKQGKGTYRESDYAGSYWDTPRFVTYFDRGGDLDQSTGLIKPGQIAGLATAQPLRNEFQRYPGHPSVTSLGLVFQNYLNAEQIYQISPRLTGGEESSLGGTNRLLNMTYWDPSFPDSKLVGGKPLPVKDARLYASVDELLFSPEQSKTGTRVLNDVVIGEDGEAAGVLDADLLAKTRFFLTAQSRAPELNLYGRPRIAIWPVDTDEKRRTAEDELISFCATIGVGAAKKPFIFQRHDPYSATNDANIPRNRALFDYLREITGKEVPGFSRNSFLGKYSSDRNQILTEIFDYIRCANLRDTSRSLDILKAHGNPAPNSTAWNTAQLEIEATQYAPRGIVLPLKVNRDGADATGFGRISTVNQAAIVLYHAGYVGTDKKGEEVRYMDPRLKETNGVKANLVRAFLILETFNPMQGYAGVRNAADSPKRAGAKVGCDIEDNNLYIHELTGLDALKIQSSSMEAPVSLGFPRRARNRLYYASAGWHSRTWGGYEGFSHTFWKKAALAPGSATFPSEEYYPFQTNAPGVAIPAADKTLSFSGGRVNLDVYFGNRYGRKIALDFPAATWPVPSDDIWSDEGGFDSYQAPPEWKWACTSARGSWARWDLDPNGDAPVKTLAGRVQWALYKSSYSPYSVTASGASTSEIVEWQTNRWRNILQPGDVVRSLIASGEVDPRTTALSTQTTTFKPHPDYFTLDYGNSVLGPDGLPLPLRHAHLLRVSAGVPYMGTGDRGDKTGGSWRANPERRGTAGGYWPGAKEHSQQWLDYPVTKFGNLVELPAGKAYPSDKAANLPPGINGVKRKDGRAGDFDTGLANLPDGAYTGKADEGTNCWGYFDTTRNIHVFEYPYYVRDRESFDSFFSPNRQMPSPVLFGSLPAGRNKNWETLNFCPNPAGGTHSGSQISPPDHLLLDLFSMPIVRPYAISEPFSTAGKVNLNYQIVPFTHIKRSTALRAALESVRVPAVSTDEVSRYKSSAGSLNYRYLVDRDEVVKSFDDFFAQFDKGNVDKGLFKSASEICEHFLYPREVSVSGRNITYDNRGDRVVRAFWESQRLTGDNLRERPYLDLYPRITTKSNTYTVHVRAQVLRHRGTPLGTGEEAARRYARWDEDKDTVAAEYRGSAMIERYLDPQDRRFDRENPETQRRGDYVDPDKASLDGLYRFRVISTRKFTAK